MRRVPIGERPDWRERARAAGFTFHTFDGAPYWDESHAYAFTLRGEIEEDIEGPAGELHALCLAFAAQAVEDERILASLRIPETAWDAVRDSWRRGDPSLYGRLDLSYGGAGPAKLLEYNADTPTALYETAVFQWLWLEESLQDRRLKPGSDQFNAVHERLIERLRSIASTGLAGFAAEAEAPEDLGTAAYLQDCAVQAGCATLLLDLSQIGLRPDGAFCGPDGQPLANLFKLYPWEWAFADPFGAAVAASPTRFLEPPWKMVLSNKGLIAHLWAREPSHPNLLPCFFEGDPACRSLGDSYVRKPLLSARAPMSRFFARGSPSPGRPAPTARKGSCGRRSPPCPISTGGAPSSAPGWSETRRRASASANRPGRSPATMPCSCRTGSSQSRGGKGRSRSGPSPIATVSGRPHPRRRPAPRPDRRFRCPCCCPPARRASSAPWHRSSRWLALHRLLRVALHAAGLFMLPWALPAPAAPVPAPAWARAAPDRARLSVAARAIVVVRMSSIPDVGLGM